MNAWGGWWGAEEEEEDLLVFGFFRIQRYYRGTKGAAVKAGRVTHGTEIGTEKWAEHSVIIVGCCWAR